ncbi:MAG: TolC family protein [Burkholderiaceae bacterium]|nr:TolC family protein [Burkholderiaceae bacterium]
MRLPPIAHLCTALALLLLVLSPAARAQALADAIAQAWSRTPLVAPLVAREDEARARLELADRFIPGAPSASVGVLDDRFHRDEGARKWEVELGVPLWLPGQQAARQVEARLLQEQVPVQRALLRWTVSGEVRMRWWALAAARAARDLASRRAETARALESNVMRRLETGDLARMDANLARNERLAADAEAVQAQALVRTQEASLSAMTGVDAPSVLPGETVVLPSPALEEHPQWRAVSAAARAADAALLATVKSDRAAPRVTLRMERDRGAIAEPFSNAVGIRVSVPFSWEPQMRQQAAAARAERLRTDAELATLRLRLQAAVDSARAELEAAQRLLELASDRQAATTDNLQLAERAFSLGETDLTSLLRVRASALEADLFEARQRIALEAARSQLNQALGVVP